MTTPLRYFALLTHMGAQKLAQAAALGKPLNITQMAVGDGNGALPVPDPAQTTLVNERRRSALNTLTTDKRNPDQLIAEQVIPAQDGGFWIREIGLYDNDGSLIAAGNCPETYKPQLQEGSGRTQIIRMVLVVSHTEAVTLKIDPSTVLATVEYVGDRIETLDNKLQQQLGNYIPHSAKSDAVTSDSGDTVATSKAVKEVHDIALQKYTAQDATTTQKGLTQLCSDTGSDDETTAATPKAVSAAMWEAQSRQPKGDYALKGDSHSKQEALNLFLQKSKNGGDIADKAAFVRNLGLSETVKQAQNAVPVTRTINGYTLKQNLTLTAGDFGAYSREETNKTFLPVNSRQAVTHGNLVIDNGTEWPGLRYKAGNGYTVGIEGSGGKGLTVWADDQQGKRRYNLSTPQKSGTLATLEDIGQKSNIPVGSPVPWPQATPPSGYLACSGQTFDKSVYPVLGAAYPSGRLPDLRGEFIRGLDSGRGVDAGRSVLSEQMGNSLLCGRGFWNDDIFKFKMEKGSVGTDNQGHREFYQQIEGKNGNETRPRNIAFLYIVRAA